MAIIEGNTFAGIDPVIQASLVQKACLYFEAQLIVCIMRWWEGNIYSTGSIIVQYLYSRARSLVVLSRNERTLSRWQDHDSELLPKVHIASLMKWMTRQDRSRTLENAANVSDLALCTISRIMSNREDQNTFIQHMELYFKKKFRFFILNGFDASDITELRRVIDKYALWDRWPDECDFWDCIKDEPPTFPAWIPDGKAPGYTRCDPQSFRLFSHRHW